MFTETSSMEACCNTTFFPTGMDTHFPTECLDVCKNELNCRGEEYKAALLILRATKCASLAKMFNNCCEGISQYLEF